MSQHSLLLLAVDAVQTMQGDWCVLKYARVVFCGFRKRLAFFLSLASLQFVILQQLPEYQTSNVLVFIDVEETTKNKKESLTYWCQF